MRLVELTPQPFSAELYRGENEPGLMGNREYAHDPGDFGRGIYWTTELAQAKCYGKVRKARVSLSNPLYLTAEEAYDLADKEYGSTVHGFPADRLRKAEHMTLDLLRKGYDGLVVQHKNGRLEVVDYRPYLSKLEAN